MNGLSIVLLIITTGFAIGLGVWYGRGLIRMKHARQSKLIEQQRKRKHNRINTVETFIVKNTTVTNREVQELLTVSRATAERYLRQLVQEGKLQQKGAGRGAHYVRK